MERKLYIRFFIDKWAQIPVNTEEITDSLEFDHNKLTLMDSVEEWMGKNPEGKVDFIYL